MRTAILPIMSSWTPWCQLRSRFLPAPGTTTDTLSMPFGGTHISSRCGNGPQAPTPKGIDTLVHEQISPHSNYSAPDWLTGLPRACSLSPEVRVWYIHSQCDIRYFSPSGSVYHNCFFYGPCRNKGGAFSSAARPCTCLLSPSRPFASYVSLLQPQTISLTPLPNCCTL